MNYGKTCVIANQWGFMCATGFFEQVCHLACVERENGETLTVEKLVRHLSE